MTDRLDHEIERSVVEHPAVDEIGIPREVRAWITVAKYRRMEFQLLLRLLRERLLTYRREGAGETRRRPAGERQVGSECLPELFTGPVVAAEIEDLRVIAVALAGAPGARGHQHLETVEVGRGNQQFECPARRQECR